MGQGKRARLTAMTVGAAVVSSLGASLTASAAPPPEPRPAAPVSPAAWAAHTTRQMSLEDKVGQLFVSPVYGSAPDSPHPRNRDEYGVDTPAQVINRYHLGGVIHFSWTDSLENPRQIADLSNGMQQAAVSSGAGIPLLNSTDQEQGSVTRIDEPVTPFPGNMALGAGRNADDTERAAAISGQELRAMGLNQNFAPSGDVNVNPQNPIIGVRSYSADPQLAAQLTAAQVRGYQNSAPAGETVSSAVKHFPGHGDTTQDSHESLPVINHSPEQWEQLDAPPFRTATRAGADTIMSGHIVVPGLDDSGEPATLSPNVLAGKLRQEIGYNGVISTDSLRMEGVRVKHPDEEIPILALQAGADELLMPKNLGVAVNSVLDAVRSGRLPEQRIDESVQRILTMKAQRGITQNPFVDASRVNDVVGTPQHRQRAQQITDRTTNVLRNDEDLLPMREKPGRMLVTGAGAEATGALSERIRARGPQTTSLPTGDAPNPDQINHAVDAAKHNDVTVVLTDAAWSQENAPQQDLVRALHRAGVKVIAVPIRDPYDAAYADEVRTWIATYSDKPVAMESLAKVLFGEISPAGTLPVSVPDPNHPGADRYPIGHGVHW